MATPSRERAARKLLQQPRHPPIGSNAAKRLMYEKQREDGWNNHFVDPLPRLPPLEKIPHSPLKKQPRQANDNFKPKKPHAPRATPPNVRLKPLTPNEPKPDEKDVLRLKAVTAIEYRENLIKQLRKLLDGIPLASPKQRGSKKLNAISSSQKGEIISVLQEMTQEIQMAGIRAVEAIVAWMLVAGKSAPTPPVFYWHDSNYFVRMHSDLDFLSQALMARGLGVVMGDKAAKSNPLLIEASQRLGRVWAAQSIITEMIEMSQIDVRNDDNNALALVDKSTEISYQREMSVDEPLHEDEDDFMDATNNTINAENILNASTTRVAIPTADIGTLLNGQEEGTDEQYDEPAYEDEMFEINEQNKAKHDQTSPAKHQDFFLPEINNEEKQIATENDIPIAEQLRPWEQLWAEIGVNPSTIEAAARLCSGLTDDVNTFVNGAVRQLEAVNQAFAHTANADQFIIIKWIVKIIDENLSSLTSKLEQQLPNDPEAVDEALESISEAIDISWRPSQETKNAFVLIQHLSATAIPSLELSRILHIMYPYIIAAPQEQKSTLCRQCMDLLNKVTLVSTPSNLLDALAKSILLMSVVRPDTKEISNLKFVCNRQRILSTSMQSIREREWFALFPSFASPTGQKIVQNQTVEAGEGRGPLKEWFELISQSWTCSYVSSLPNEHIDHEIILLNRNLQAPSSHFANYSIVVGSRLRLQDNDYTIKQFKEGGNDIIVAVIDPPWKGDETIINARDIEWFEPLTPLFIYIKASESYWLNEQAISNTEFCKKLEFVGWTLAMALLHQTTISIQLHEVFFSGLLSNDFHLTLDHIKALDPPLHKSLVALYSLPDFDQVLALEELPQTMTVDEYINRTINEKQSAIAWQLDAIRTGFNAAMPQEFCLCLFTSLQLRELVCGPPASEDFDIKKVFKVVYHDGFAEASMMQSAFWRVIDSLTTVEKRLFVKFVTGIDKLPLPQTEFLRLDIPMVAKTEEENKIVLHRLPQAHTCENTLEIPDYCSGLRALGIDDNDTLRNELVEIFGNKLRYAIAHGNGFDLDMATGLTTQNTMKPPPQHELSSDSIDLPNLDDEPTPFESPKKEVAIAAASTTTEPEDIKDDDYSFDDFE